MLFIILKLLIKEKLSFANLVIPMGSIPRGIFRYSLDMEKEEILRYRSELQKKEGQNDKIVQNIIIYRQFQALSPSYNSTANSGL